MDTRVKPAYDSEGQAVRRHSPTVDIAAAVVSAQPMSRRREFTMILRSIRRKIMAIAVALIALMAVTAVWTVVLVLQVGERIEDLTYSYMPAYSDLARANIRSLERAVSIRQIIIDRLTSPGSSAQQT